MTTAKSPERFVERSKNTPEKPALSAFDITCYRRG
jgi:hypothetical protein